nr:hypothetical protein [Tanacetum cinerariifolium]
VFSILKAFGRNTRDLGSFGEETDKTTDLHQHLLRLCSQWLEAALKITRDAVTPITKMASQESMTAQIFSPKPTTDNPVNSVITELTQSESWALIYYRVDTLTINFNILSTHTHLLPTLSEIIYIKHTPLINLQESNFKETASRSLKGGLGDDDGIGLVIGFVGFEMCRFRDNANTPATNNPLILPTALHAKIVQELNELQAISTDIDSRLENIDRFLNGFTQQPNEIDVDDLEPDDLVIRSFLSAYLEQHELHANEVRIMRQCNQDPLALVTNHQMTPSHFNTYQSSYNNPQFQQQFSPSQSPQHYSTTYPSTPLAITYPSAPYPNAYSSTIDSGLAVLVFKQGGGPIDAINKMMSFLSTIVTSCFLYTNNQLRSSSNPRQQATIHDGRVTIQPLQGRSNSYVAEPKRKRDATWFMDKVLLVEAQGNGKVLNEEELEFLVDPSIAEGPVTYTVIKTIQLIKPMIWMLMTLIMMISPLPKLLSWPVCLVTVKIFFLRRDFDACRRE